MQSTSTPGRIQVTEAVHAALRDRFAFEERGPIEVKGKGKLVTYFLVAPRSAHTP
jgi:class 3 adenylate cyclase